MAAQLNQKNLSSLQIASFCTQLSLLIKAGISLQEGIHILYEDASSQAEKELLKQILEPIEEGQPLAFSLRQTDAFPQYMVEMVEIGETSGKLEEVLDSLTEYYERSENISKSIRSAVTYPMIMILMMAVVIGVLMIKVLPIFRQVFSQLGTEMSSFSQSIMDFGSIVGIIASVFIGLILLLIIIALVLRMTPSGQKTLSNMFSRLPVIKPLYRKMASGRFASAMALMLSSGLDTDQALLMTQQLITDQETSQKISSMQQQIHEGSSFADALVSVSIFSSVYARMVSVGFRTGAIDSVMAKIAHHYEDEVNDKIASIIGVLEPTFVAILSIVIGMILLSVMLPLMGVMSSIG